ncbi:MAG: hypothetical protein HFI87_07175 [Bacilli bacterium]|nr:hypothetical protein [Bacilli bacterium]
MYGSVATSTFNSKSDYEIGVIFKSDNYVSRKQIKEIIPQDDYSIFPFKFEEILTYDIDTPFQKEIYIATLIKGGAQILRGKNIFQELTIPTITKACLLEDIYFNKGLALSAVKIFKTGNIDLSNEQFYKSCFYVTRDLIYFKQNYLCITYKDIYLKSKEIDIPKEYRILLDLAYDLRVEKKSSIDSTMYFKNISFINKYIEKELKLA